MQQYQLTFIDLALRRDALRFGKFTLKSGRESPYFFNAGLFSDGDAAHVLGGCYAAAIVRSGLPFDMLFGPAYKGIPLATATAIALAAEHARNVAYAFNRKEAKQHGEGGNIVGTPLQGRVLVVDDVITAGTAVRESLGLIRAAGAEVAGRASISHGFRRNRSRVAPATRTSSDSQSAVGSGVNLKSAIAVSTMRSRSSSRDVTYR